MTGILLNGIKGQWLAKYVHIQLRITPRLNQDRAFCFGTEKRLLLHTLYESSSGQSLSCSAEGWTGHMHNQLLFIYLFSNPWENAYSRCTNINSPCYLSMPSNPLLLLQHQGGWDHTSCGEIGKVLSERSFEWIQSPTPPLLLLHDAVRSFSLSPSHTLSLWSTERRSAIWEPTESSASYLALKGWRFEELSRVE